LQNLYGLLDARIEQLQAGGDTSAADAEPAPAVEAEAEEAPAAEAVAEGAETTQETTETEDQEA
jgi:hypothetical protein